MKRDKSADLPRNIRLIAGVLLGLFVLLCAYASYSVYFYGGRWFANPYNPRLRAAKQQVRPGDILDRTGLTLVTTDENGTRTYPQGSTMRKAVSHIIGDAKALVPGGVETFHAGYLLGINAPVLSRLGDLFSEGRRGDDVYLTIDAALQRYAHDAFPSDHDGAAVILNYKTGEVLLMYSKPEFDPKRVNEAGTYVSSGSELVNRVTQGRYTPGSIFKTITAAAALDTLPNAAGITFDCESLYGEGERPIKDSTAHGELALDAAFTASCNIYFGRLAEQLGERSLRKTAEQAAFNQDFLFRDIAVNASIFPDGKLSEESRMWAGVGQDTLTVTPLHMAMIAGAVANGGEMMEPTTIRQVSSADGRLIRSLTTRTYRRAFSSGTAAALKDMMLNVVQSGTGTRAAVKGYTVGGKTGTAQVSDSGAKQPHAWFIGFIDDPDMPLCIAVVVENGGSGSGTAAPLASKLLKKAAELLK